jgi:hypothetical protein
MAKRMLTFGALGVLCAAIGSAAALGDGGPVYVLQGQDGIARGNVRYVAFANGNGTVLEVIQRRGGRVLNYTFLPGNYGIPMVAFDGTTDGLSRDGRTLILGDVSGGPELQKNSSFAVVDVRRFRLRQTIQLRGDFAFDALSPNGRMLYLIQHVSIPESRYRVRVYDRFAGLLLPKTVTDRRRWQSVMQGVPVARATTRDGRWAYTVYGANDHPFVHALDTVKGQAVCIDLPRRNLPSNHYSLRARIGPNGRLVVHTIKGRVTAVIDRRSFRVVGT